MKLKELLIESLEKDTRDDSNLYVYRLKGGSISKTDFQKVRNTLKNVSCYYSKFKKGFICKNKVDLENVKVANKKTTTSTSNKVVYYKTLLEYITLDEIKEFYKSYAKDNFNKHYMYNRYATATAYYKELCDNLDNTFKKGVNSYSNKLSYIRAAIIWKSLGFDKEKFRANGDELYYLAFWEKIPTIKDLKMTDKAYTSLWGYDQTNVDITYLLNKRFNGLNVLVDTKHCMVYFTRLKNDCFNDGVRYFNRDYNPEQTFQMDASVTGNYH